MAQPQDLELRAHKDWLGFLQPVGLVVSPLALSKAQAVVNRNILPVQQALQTLVRKDAEERAYLEPGGFPAFAQQVLGWEPGDLWGAPGAPPLPDDLPLPLPDYGETLEPTYAVPDPDRPSRFLLLVKELPTGAALDDPGPDEGRSWHASPQAKFERLLREREVPAGLLLNGLAVRLTYAPRGETSGHLSFPIQAMTEVPGRLILGALHMLLGTDRVFSGPVDRRLLALLAESRKYQNEVSTQLAEQVLGALIDLLGGFQAADEASAAALLSGVAAKDIYGGLLTTLLRLVFLLYAEDRGLLPRDPVYSSHYAVTGLYERLREDVGRNPDTMDQRYGAWAHLLSLFRLIYHGGAHGELRLLGRRGQLFDPDEYPFLEGRPVGQRSESMGLTPADIQPPRVSDGVIYRVLQGLLVLKGERLSYRALDVEQIGSVYEAMMGFEIQRAAGPSIAVLPQHVVVNLRALLAAKPTERAKLLKEWAACDLSAKEAEALREASTPEAAVAALGRKASHRTPAILPPGAMYLQPGEERRRSGSHYTPRTLTGPIVQTTLRPVLEALGPNPSAAQLLDLKVCDPAMGSGAFLVEACRQLAERLVAAWEHHRNMPPVPPDEEPLLHARRLVAQRCLYGVDKNPFAVNLAKLSLWLVTLAKDHPFTFLDHALKHGDSLVGLTRRQIGAFTWQPEHKESGPLFANIKGHVDAARVHREAIQALGEDDEGRKRELHREAEDAIASVRQVGDLVVAAFFAEEKDKARETRRRELDRRVQAGETVALQGLADELRQEWNVVPFHWEIEFPEVFGRENPGFDAMVGNPPFAGKNSIINSNAAGYLDWLKEVHEGAHGNADLVAHFFRRAFNLLRDRGTFGLIATNTIAQGDTRSTGLRWICEQRGNIYEAQKRLKWPGLAAVVVSVVHIQKGRHATQGWLGGAQVPLISAFLFHAGGNDDPVVLSANANKSFQGSILLGMGFTFDDTSKEASRIVEKERLIAKDSRNAERIFPYLGGDEVNSSPEHKHHRFVINFGEMTEQQARQWPDLLKIVEEKVKPKRLTDNRESYRRYWWQYAEKRGELFRVTQDLERVLVCSRHQHHWCVASVPTGPVFSEALIIFALRGFSSFAVMQSRLHEIWARFFGSSLEDRLRYTPSDCFETFPFPENCEQNHELETSGKTYLEFRAVLMAKTQQGMTDTYNRFHDPDERDPDILKLRELHAAMDRAVLDAYGWTDIPTACEFRLDYEEDEDSDEAPSRRKKPYRLRWPAEVHDEVLARLLDLNQKRAEAERLAGALAEPKAAKVPPKPRRPRKDKTDSATPSLFGSDPDKETP
ncbi:MAG TPA: N-6 DNA methylase [Pseudomonadota bacterium]|nr:N-6 DNA methylase [Pseudomonadota bacterium]